MPETWPLSLSIGVFLAAGAFTVAAGIRLTRGGDVLADRTRLGEALFGAVFFGAIISLSGIAMTAGAAASGYAKLGYSNAIGGIAAQTAALGVADIAYRKANLEHAAASLPNMLFSVFLVMLLVISQLTGQTPDVTLLGIHPGSLVLLTAYVVGVRAVRKAQDEPLWLPKRTRETVPDEPNDEEQKERSTWSLFLEFVGLGIAVAVAGWAVSHAAQGIVEHAGIDESVVGAVFMGLVNAIPETVTAVAAVRRGALTLAIGGVLGGNTFDVLNLVVGDVAYRAGSLHHAAGQAESTLVLGTTLMITILLAGLLRRERSGPANIGWESVLMLTVYGGTIALVSMGQ